MRRTRYLWLGLMWASWLAAGCAVDSEPRLDRWTDGTYRAVVLTGHEIKGQRDGATTEATVELTTDDGTRIEVQLEIHYDPTPSLRAGSWSSNGETGQPARAESLEFVGGQGEGPSVGGIFLLQRADGSPGYRLRLPLQRVSDGGWDVDS